MQIFRVKDKVDQTGEYILGAEQTGSHACYLIYGTMGPREKERLFRPGKGHEELLLVIKGGLEITGHLTGYLNEGQAVHLKGEETCQLENRSDETVVYVVSGGHSEHGHH